MNYKIMDYKAMRGRKYYDAARTNRSFLKAPLVQKLKIVINVLKFFRTNAKKPLVIHNKPVTAQIEPTSECNFRCNFCIRNDTGVPIGNLSFKDFRKILRNLDSLFKINLSGQGELFLHPEIFDMIKYANRRGILVNVNSNGSLFTPKIIDKICECDIGEVGVSIDSTYKKKFEKVRINSDFNKIVKGVKNLTSELKKRKRNTLVTIAAILFKDNIDEIPKFIELAKKIGVKKVAFQTLQTKENYMDSYGTKMKSQIVTGEVQKLKDKMKEAQVLAKKYGITLIFDEDESPGCIWPWRGIYINWEGDVTPCCKIVEHREHGLGNLLKQDFWDVWNGPEYQEIRKLLRARKAPGMCAGCNRI